MTVDTESDLKAWVGTILDEDPDGAELVLEQLLVGSRMDAPWGDYIAVDCLAEPSGIRPLFVTAKFALQAPFRERGGYGPPREPSSMVREVEDLACAAVAGLGIDCGIADVEIKLTPDGPRVIEVNGRLGAWVDDLSLRLGGPDMVATAMECALGRRSPVRASPSAPRAPIAYNYVLVPPLEVTRFEGRDLFGRLRALPGVEGVERYKDDFDDTDWRRGATSSVGAVRGSASDHGELSELVNAIEAEFKRSFGSEPDRGDIRGRRSSGGL